MKKLFVIFVLTFFIYSCEESDEVYLPKLTWDLFESPDATWLGGNQLAVIEGVYSVTEGSDVFGSQVAVKSSYSITGSDTTRYISFLCGQDISYFISQAKELDSSILLNGYWRKMVSTETGVSRFIIDFSRGAGQILSSNPVIGNDSIIIEGLFGVGEDLPDRKITLRYVRPLHIRNGYQVLAHRAGGRTSDQLRVSENSVAMILKTQQFGSTGIEIDVRLTSDGVPILYHDNNINNRLVQPNGMTGPIANYSYTQLNALARLINEEKIPTLREALDAVVYRTALEYVWLDIKFTGDLEVIRQIQAEYIQKAANAGRSVEILMGLPTDDQVNDFKRLSDYVNVPSLCELSIDDVRALNSKVWAPRWTQGTQNTEVTAMHSEGRKSFTWTMDVPEYISQFINGGEFDGILTNYPSIVAYYEYTR